MTKIKTITVITAFFYPEDTAIGLYTTQFARFLEKKGYRVVIITGFPNYPQWKIHQNYVNFPSFFTETVDNIEIIRYKQYVPEIVNLKGRLMMMFDLFYGTCINLRKIKNTDLVICIVPFTICILPALLLSKVKKAKLWIHIQDFEFDLALDSGIIKNNTLFFMLFKKSVMAFEKKMMNSAAIVSSISASMIDKIKQKSIKTDSFYFPNWVSSEIINPETSTKHSILNYDKFTLLYSGNIGEKQDWDFLKKLCVLILPDENIEIVIVGDGAYKNNLKEKLKSFPFVRYFDPVPYLELNDLLCSANVHFLFQKIDVVDTIMPSKILGMMASKKPSLISGNENSEVLTIINQSGGGFYFFENDVKGVYKTILKLKNNSTLCEDIGQKARSFVLNTFSEQEILENFNSKIKSVLS
ncbi:glycosyltransferase family 4 protein [Flavobacterium sp. RSP15]|uniref:glycosyltransferase family 4 protein n=1 Tax=Flavobacterium sp. RSP15 TaxID=2497485 RepID=UPI000F82B37A|nr:glycosyltransferase family 4 protein [Flavobacterium sp. RSP15]RTY88277.1 glycosyltransferase WbuB [Flavobacterium sp. RSP15]